MEGKCLFSIPKVGITGRHIIILEFAKVGVMVIAFPIILVPSVVITSLSNPLIRLELRLSLFFGVVVSIEPNALGLIIAPAELFALEYVSHGIHTFTNDSRLGYCSTLPFSSFVFSAYPTNCLVFRCPDVPTASIPVVAKLMPELHLAPFPLISTLRLRNVPEAITPLNDNSREVTAVASFSAERELNACYIRAVRHNALMPSTGASAKNPQNQQLVHGHEPAPTSPPLTTSLACLAGIHPRHALDGVAPTASNNPEALLICIMPNEERLYLG